MSQSSRMVSFAVCVAALLLLAQRAGAQNYVTPVAQTTPPGQLIVVNNSPGADHSDPHVSGDLVAYSNSDGTDITIRYFDLASVTILENFHSQGCTSLLAISALRDECR